MGTNQGIDVFLSEVTPSLVVEEGKDKGSSNFRYLCIEILIEPIGVRYIYIGICN